MKRIIIGIISVLGITGCSTAPVSPSDARLVQPIIKYQKQEGSVPLTIVRDKGMIASACDITIYINGEQVASLGSKDKVIAYVIPGETIIGAGFIGSGLCKGPERKERSFIIADRTPRNFRIFIDQSANVDILPSTIN